MSQAMCSKGDKILTLAYLSSFNFPSSMECDTPNLSPRLSIPLCSSLGLIQRPMTKVKMS